MHMLKLTFDSGGDTTPTYINPQYLVAARARDRSSGSLVCLHPIVEEQLPTGGNLDPFRLARQGETHWFAVKESLKELQKAMEPSRPRPAKKTGQVF